MGILRPVAMERIGVVGLKADRETILAVLHDLRAMQVETVAPSTLTELTAERASDLQRAVSDQLLRFRGLAAVLPDHRPDAPRISYASIEAILAEARTVPVDDEVGALKREEDQLLSERAGIVETEGLLSKFAFYADRLDILTSRSVLAFFGEAPAEEYDRLRGESPALTGAAYLVESRGPRTVLFLVAVQRAQAEALGRLAQQAGVQLLPAPNLSGPASEERPKLAARRAVIEARLTGIRERLSEISGAWLPTIRRLEEALAIEGRKLEQYPKMAGGPRSIAVEGWVPKRDHERVVAALQAATDHRIEPYVATTEDTPPTLLDNPPGVRWYEFFVRFYSLPQATEWDPTFTFALVFPILFGIMLGDVGYGVVILGFCLWMIAGFPGREHVPKGLKGFLTRIMAPPSMRRLAYALVPGCLVGITVGILTNAYFGIPLPFYHGLFDPLKNASQMLLFAGYLGLAMVDYGFVLGALTAYFHKHYRHALAKVGGILLATGIACFGLGLLRGAWSLSNTGPLLSPTIYLASWLGMAIGLALMFYGEGAAGAGLGFLEVLSHILSYTRLVGILLASAVLALVINSTTLGIGGGSGLIFSGAAVGIVLGILILVMGQVFNLVLGVFEPGIQGARLIFVEHFSKFYEGNGRPFRPLGSERTHTVSAFLGQAPPQLPP